MVATAAPVSRWLLVEQPGHWGRDALRSRAEPAAASALLAAAASAGVRVVVIRRPGRAATAQRLRGLPGHPASDRAWAYVDSRPGSETVRWGRFTDHRQLLGGPLAGTAGNPDSRPVYLVCAHGRHDACCAIRGRPVAAALALLRPDQVWECSHVGGDRFAANAVVLPEGLYYGHLGVHQAGDVVEAYDAGHVVPALLRGRSSFPSAVQAAQHHARLVLAERRIAALSPVAVQQSAARSWQVRLAHDHGIFTVWVQASYAPPQRLTCSSAFAQPVPVFRCTGWRIDSPVAGPD